MNKLFIRSSLSGLVIIVGIAQSSYAASALWNQISGWFGNKTILADTTNPVSSSTGKTSVIENDLPSSSAPAPKWTVSHLPAIAIKQTDYQDINLNDYLAGNEHTQKIIFSLTPDKPNPHWVSLRNNKLNFLANQISPEDIDTVQVIYITATDTQSGKSADGQMTINITANSNLPAPEWNKDLKLSDAVPDKNYFNNLANNVDIAALPENDQLSFQIIHSSAGWLQMGPNGFSLVAHKIPAQAANKEFDIVLRVSSKMSGKSNDYIGKLYVNPKPQPLQWRDLPAAIVNKNYSIDLRQYVSSNLRNDQFYFNVDLATLPHWLKIDNNFVLKGIPQEARLLDHPQKISVFAKSTISGVAERKSLLIPMNSDSQLAPSWKKDFFNNPISGEAYRSDDLFLALDKHYSYDQLTFKYVNGPNWLSYNNFCHCIASKGRVPDDTAGKSYPVELQVYSKASGQTSQYAQNITVYTGIPTWSKTSLPDIRIGQLGGKIKIALSNFTQDDISSDAFSYRLDLFHSPRWVKLVKEQDNFYLILNPNVISIEEVGASQSVRIIAISARTHKTSVQLLSIKVLPNNDLPKPAWKGQPLSIATVGFQHVVDVEDYISTGIPNDKLTI
ncbi:MAG: hypothetical protein JSR33_06705, partial [Proteobacteria bacterium]|nr:hypothetical protein [Pseudomonadota bacterium]